MGVADSGSKAGFHQIKCVAKGEVDVNAADFATLSGYLKDGTGGIKLAGLAGTATTPFTLPSGSYDVEGQMWQARDRLAALGPDTALAGFEDMQALSDKGAADHPGYLLGTFGDGWSFLSFFATVVLFIAVVPAIPPWMVTM